LAGIATANNEKQAVIMTALGIGAYIGIELPFSRTHETEADEIGQRLMALAGFDPSHAVRLWTLIGGNGKRQPELLSTHPNPNNRAERLKRNLDEMTPLYLQAKASGKNPQCSKPAIPKPITPKSKAPKSIKKG
jgi:predicted Zn-dependent protease